jgi:N-acetylated-alpha-linked acidic dipeptidase
MRRCVEFGATMVLILLSTASTTGSGHETTTLSPLGFAPASRAAQAAAELHAVGVPTPENARAWLRTLTEEPHVAGTEADYKTAVFVRDKLRAWGWQADMAEYEVLLNYPNRSLANNPRLELVRPGGVKPLPLREAPNPADKDSDSPAAFPAFHGYGVSGDVTGQVVYANYGQPEDFTALEKLGVDVKDRIVLVRYGAIFRGLKIRNAQKRGAKGVLIYSDPIDDGYAKGDVYPSGPFRPGSALQRGSAQFLSLGPGDPSTPNGPSVKGAKRLPFDTEMGFTTTPQRSVEAVKAWEKTTGLVRNDYFASIPSLPISYEAAKPILEALGGPNVPAGWQGGLPLPYHVGPGPAEVHFAIWMEYAVRTVWNVIATLKGTVEPDRWIMIGNHRDAWVYGAVDPGSGTAATLETCRALGAAVKHGWKPRRTIVYASWDAEEYGLVGSTEWADEHAKEIDEKAVLLLNVDSAVGGRDLDMDGVPSLRDFLLDATAAVKDARSGRTLLDVWIEKKRSQWAATAPLDFGDPLWDNPDDSAATIAARTAVKFSPHLNPLGSGSDYTAFLDHLAVPSLDVGFAGGYGVYHSVYDNFYWMEKFCDPEFLTHATAARLYTVIAMRAASAEVVPFTFTPYGEALREYLDDLRRIVERRARALTSEKSRTPFSFAGLTALVKSVRAFQTEAAALDRATAALAGLNGVDAARLARVNDALKRVERAFLLPDGLPGRPWFKHAVYAPGLTTGYACWPLPGVRQAILDNDGAMLAKQSVALVARIDAATEALRAATNQAKAAAVDVRATAR